MADKALIISEDQSLTAEIVDEKYGHSFEFFCCSTYLDGLDHLVSEDDFAITLIDLSAPWETAIQSLYPLRWVSNTFLLAMLHNGGRRDKAHILDIADDCILLPAELERVTNFETQASNRRLSPLASHSKKPFFYNRGLLMFPMQFRIFFGNVELHPTRIEYDILFYLIRNRDSIVSRDQILDDVWRHRYYSENDKTVSVHIRAIRKMLFDVTDEVFIETIRGFGYRFVTEGTKTRADDEHGLQGKKNAT